MDDAESEHLKEQLRAMVAGRGDGIDLDSVDRWVIERLQDPVPFFRHLGNLIPADSILYFEGSAISPDAAQLYQKNRTATAVCVARDTIFPVPEIYHVAMSPGFIDSLIDLLRQAPVESCFHHLKAYRTEKLLFTFHDAFNGSPLLVSDRVSEEVVRAFTSNLNVVYGSEPNANKRDPEQFRRFLISLENTNDWRMNRPWWKKTLFFWKK